MRLQHGRSGLPRRRAVCRAPRRAALVRAAVRSGSGSVPRGPEWGCGGRVLGVLHAVRVGVHRQRVPGWDGVRGDHERAVAVWLAGAGVIAIVTRSWSAGGMGRVAWSGGCWLRGIGVALRSSERGMPCIGWGLVGPTGLHSGSTRPSASSVVSSTSASSPGMSGRILSTSADFGIARS